ncbi:MAG: hypothetical protein R6V12_01215, partial [Candidatus Hydrogenedentota bacterium]
GLYPNWIDSVEMNHLVYSTPAVADIQGDDDLEIVIGCDDGELRCIDKNGNQIWIKAGFNFATYSSPIIVNIDGGNDIEVINGSSGRPFT